MDILLSIGMIVKNEARCLEKCLKALEPLRRAVPCELVIADTGSTDGTRQIAEKYADILFDFPWVNDFSAARNAVMDRCSGKWYLSIDADEYLDPNIDDLLTLLYEQESEWPDACLVTVRNYLSPEIQYSTYSDFFVLRLARLNIGICYKGSIHEFFQKNSQKINIDQIECLKGVILHHDGYALESKEAQKAKAKRNLDILDQELKKRPDDLILLGQCIESASKFPDRLIAYIMQSADILHRSDEDTLNHNFSAPVVASHCALIAVYKQLPQAREWIQWSKDHYPTHIATLLDTTFAAIMLEYGNKNYDSLLELTDQYLQAYERYKQKDVPLIELSTSVLRAANETHYYKVKAVASVALEKQGALKESLDMLTGWPIHALSGESLQDCIKALIWHGNTAAGQAVMADILHEIEQRYAESESSIWIKEQYNSLQEICQALFLEEEAVADDQPKEPWRILLKAEGTLGLAARVMASTDNAEITQFLSEVSDWDAFPPNALEHAFQYGVPFPDSMSQQSIEWLQTTTRTIAENCKDFGTLLLPWIKNSNCDSLFQTQLHYWMLIAALTKKETFSDEETAIQLCEYYTEVAEKYFNHFYHPDVLDSDHICCSFNQIDHFSMNYLTARSALVHGDQRMFIHSLRLGLRTAPQMKEFVEYLLYREKNNMRTKASPELLALAEKVRSILAQYPSDDPAVMALKKSEAYRKVAYLIDNIEES